jgi:hypothetical protein
MVYAIGMASGGMIHTYIPCVMKTVRGIEAILKTYLRN